MDFNELKMIWDTQEREPLFAIDEPALQRRVEKEARRMRRNDRAKDLNDIVFGLMVTGYFGVQGLRLATREHDAWKGWCLLGTAAAYLVMVAYVAISRLLQRRRESRQDASLRGDLDRVISHLEYRIRLFRGSPWWCLLPVLTGTALATYVIAADESRLDLWPAILLAILIGAGLIHWCMRWTVRTKLLPKKHRFEELRDRLVHSGNPQSSEN